MQFLTTLQRSHPLPRTGFSDAELDDYIRLERDRFLATRDRFWEDFQSFSESRGQHFKRTRLLKGTFSLLGDTLSLGDWYAIGAPIEFLCKLVTGYRIEFNYCPTEKGPIDVQGRVKTDLEWQDIRDYRDKNVKNGRILRVPPEFCLFINDVFMLHKPDKSSCIVNARPLNAFIQPPDSFCLPKVETVFEDGLSRDDLLIKGDLKGCFMQLPLHIDSMRYACFKVKEEDDTFSYYTFPSLFYGLCDAPYTCCTNFGNYVMEYFQKIFGFAVMYVDDC